MDQPTPDRRPVALTIAGSDSGGGAGIQADIQAMAAHGAFATSVVTAVTAQNTMGVEDTHVVPPDSVAAQYDAVVEDFDVQAVKTGMLATTAIIETVSEGLAELDTPLVVDPVMVAASGDRLLASKAEAAYENLIAEATLVTPNADEAAVLVDIEPTDEETAIEAGRALVDLGAEAALIKGGHIDADPVRDYLVTEEHHHVFEHPRIDTDATHGSGCVLSSTIAATLATGDSLTAAVETGVGFMERAVRNHYDLGNGPGAVNPLVDLRDDY